MAFVSGRSGVVGVLVLMALSGGAFSEPISYQGSLEDEGIPANGEYDLRFRLYDDFGIQLGSTIDIEDVEIEGGLFSVDIPFTDGVFDVYDNLFLAVHVRDGDSVGGYTEMAPWSSITPAPLAVRAAKADNAEFERVSNNLLLGDTNERLLMNPDLSGGTFLNGSTDLQLNFDGGLWGGVYIHGDTANSMPFYGFAREGNTEAYIALEGPTGAAAMTFTVDNSIAMTLFAFRTSINTELLVSREATFADDVEVEGSLHSLSTLSAGANVTAGLEVSAGADVVAGDDLVAQNDVFVSDDIILEDDLIRDYGDGDYRYGLPVAFGTISSAGVIQSGSGNFSVVFNGALEQYQIDLPVFYSFTNYTTVVTPVSSDPTIASSNSISGDLLVYFFNLLGERVPTHFSFVVYSNASAGQQTP